MIIIMQQLKGQLGLKHFTYKTDLISVLRSIFTQTHEVRFHAWLVVEPQRLAHRRLAQCGAPPLEHRHGDHHPEGLQFQSPPPPVQSRALERRQGDQPSQSRPQLIKRRQLEGGDPSSIWVGNRLLELAAVTAVMSLGQMLSEGIHIDITINAINGSIGAHRAVLVAQTPVFHSMFSCNLKEKELFAVDISDMSIEDCQAFLDYIYVNVPVRRVPDPPPCAPPCKYAITDLNEVCHESLTEDIDTKNVLERQRTTYLYRLPKLNSSCMRYLVNFGKIYDIDDDFNAFLQSADRDLIVRNLS